MSRVAQQLEEIRIVSHDDCPTRTMEGFDCRRRAGLGAFRDSAEIAALNPCAWPTSSYGMEGRAAREPRHIACAAAFDADHWWRCLRTLVDGRSAPSAGAIECLIISASSSTPITIKFPEWYKQVAFAGATQGVATHQTKRGGDDHLPSAVTAAAVSVRSWCTGRISRRASIRRSIRTRTRRARCNRDAIRSQRCRKHLSIRSTR